MPQRITASDPAATALKALEIMERLADEPDGLGLNAIAREVGSSRSSAVRLLAALESRRMVARHPETRKYRLTLRLLELGTKVLDQLELPDLARPHLQTLSHRSGETAHLGVLEGRDVVFVVKAEPPSPFQLRARVGARAPSHCTGLGKVLISALPESERDRYLQEYEFTPYTKMTITSASRFGDELAVVRRQGFAMDRSEHVTGICCIAAPVRDVQGRVVAGASVCGPEFRMRGEARKQLVRLVVETASAISAELGWSSQRRARVSPRRSNEGHPDAEPTVPAVMR